MARRPNFRLDLLTKPLFLLGLLLLILNDHYLKQHFGNALTGKLSDFAGLFVFPYFLSVFRVSSAKIFHVFSVIFFVYWKSPLSQGLLDLLHSAGVPCNRVVDYTDFVALVMIPFSYFYFQRVLQSKVHINQAFSILTACTAFLAITSTSLAFEDYTLNLPVSKEYQVNLSKKRFFSSMEPHGNIDREERYMKDSLFCLFYDASYKKNHFEMTAYATITVVDANSIIVRLDTIATATISEQRWANGIDEKDTIYLRAMSKEQLIKDFEENFISKIKYGQTDKIGFQTRRAYRQTVGYIDSIYRE